MHLINLAPLEFDRSCVHVSWSVEPSTPIYSRTYFTLDFGNELDPRELPLDLWWTVTLLCLHSHWNLLRPCRIALPVGLSPNTIEFWLRLMDVERVSLEATRGTTDFERTVELVCQGEMPAPVALPPPVDRYATAFSGGKDSLTQAALLSELSSRPLLVNTQDPMPPLLDHAWPYRERTMSEVRKRRPVELVIVKSDLRTVWPHYEITHSFGYKLSMAQITDCFLYAAALLAVAASRGIRSLQLAAELEVNRINMYEDQIAMSYPGYAPPTIGALDRLFRRWGMRYSSLLAPFTDFQIEQLLRQRFQDLAELQISCFWMTDASQQSCSHCRKCFRVALMLLALDQDPASVGIDLDQLFDGKADYPKQFVDDERASMCYTAARVNLGMARRFFQRRRLWQELGLGESGPYRRFKRLVNELAPQAERWIAQTHSAYFGLVDPALRERLEALSMEYWPEVDLVDHTGGLDRIDATVRWIAEPLKSAV